MLKVKYLDHVKRSAANGAVRAIYARADREYGRRTKVLPIHSRFDKAFGVSLSHATGKLHPACTLGMEQAT